MPAPVLQFKRGNAGVAGTVPALRPGEPAISLNNFDFFIGIDTSVANNKFFGSHRYWGREDGTNSLKLKLVDKNGSNYVAIKSPDTLGGIVTYTLPGTQGGNQTVLTNDGSGNLSWSSGSLNAVFSGITTIGGDFLDVNANTDFSGITTFSNTTDNTLGNPDTGAVQIDGGLGVNKNVTVGAGLSVVGESYFIGTATFYGGQINLGDTDGDNISVAGEFVSNLVPNATNTYDLGLTGKRWRNGFYSGNVDITGNLIVDGTATIGGGTTVILYGQDVYIKNKDIILGYTTSITGADASTDDTANHAGVAIASTVGTPLASFAASGINTLPDTYKQMMWFHAGTLGFGTDAFAFNYGVAIGTTTMADGVRLAVGSGVTVGDTSVSATNFYGNASSANQVKTVTASDTNATYHITFVDSHNGSATNETVYTDDGIYYNPGANKLTTQHAEFTGDVVVSGITSLGGNVSLGNSGSDLITVVGVTTFTTSNVYINNQLYVGGLQITGGASITGEDITARHLNLSGIATVTGLIDGNGGLDITGHSELDDVNVSGATTVASLNATGNVTLGDTSGDTITVKGTTTFEQPIVGTIGTATRATQVDTTGTSTNADYYVTFVDTLAGQTSETLRVGAGLSVNPSTGDVKTTGRLSVGDPAALTSYIKAGGGSDAMYLYGNGDVSFQQKVIVGGLRSSSNSNNTLILSDLDATFARNVNITGVTTTNTLNVGTGGTIITATLDSAGSLVGVGTTNPEIARSYVLSGNALVVDGSIIQGSVGLATFATLRAKTATIYGVNQTYGLTKAEGGAEFGPITFNKGLVSIDTSGNLNVTGITTVGTGVGITQFSSSVSTGTSTSSVPTSSAVIDYVGAQVAAVDLTTSLAGDSGTGSVSTSQTLTIAGTASEIETSASGQTITVGLPDAVVVGTSLSAPTLRTGTIQSSNTGATAITIAANDVTIADDLTVGGNLYVNGNTTQVNTTAMTVEDRTIELGVVDGSAPSTTTTWDLGVLFNYYDGSAKKSAVVWEQGDQRFKLAGVLASDTNGTNNSTPQLTVTTFAPIEVSELWINNSCTGGASQVIACSGAELVLQNITVDAGTF